MKNSKGIVIKPGQVWSLYDFELETKVIGYDGPAPVCAYDDFYRDFVSENFAELLESHGADLETAREEGWEVWVEGMEKPDPESCESMQVWFEGDCLWTGVGYFTANSTYRYKLKEEEQPICPGCKKAWDHTMLFDDGNELKCPDCVAKAEQPRYKLFEIDWRMRPEIQRGSGLVMQAVDCPLIDGYRIFGFTDHDDWTVRTEKTIEEHGSEYCAAMDIVPCDHAGNRKYAIGRFEG